jgi:hypothetical protein
MRDRSRSESSERAQPEETEHAPDMAAEPPLDIDLALPLPPPIKRVTDPDLAPRLPQDELCNLLVAVAVSNELPVGFFANLIWQESRFDHRAISRAGAQGVAQFMPGTADDVGLDNPFNARDALPASGRLLRQLRERFGNLGLAAAAYNAGPRRVSDWLAKRGGLPRETRDYIRIVTGEPADHWDDEKPQPAVYRVPRSVPCHNVAWFAEIEQAQRARMEAERARAEAEAAEKRRIAELERAAARKRKAAARRLAKAKAQATAEAKGSAEAKGESETKGPSEASAARAKDGREDNGTGEVKNSTGAKGAKTSAAKPADVKKMATRKRASRTKVADGDDRKDKRKTQ